MKKNKSNSGFTLVELVVALAMLAFIMTAVSALMGNSVLSFRKSKADISVQNEAQAFYDKVSDVIMQAKKITIHGYERTFTDQDAIDEFLYDYRHGKNGDVISGSYAEFYYVATDDDKTELAATGVPESQIKLFSKVEPTTLIFVIDMSVDVAVTIDGELFSETEKDMMDALTGKPVHVKKESISPLYYNVNDTERDTFTFIDKKIYLEREYALQTGKNDTVADWSSGNIKYNLYCDTMKYMSDGTNSIPGCMLSVDGDTGAIGLYVFMDDKNFSYVTNGMVKLRNSDVLENK